MSGIPILDSRAFLEQDVEAVTLPGPWMVANCRETIHPDPAVQAFRTAVPVRWGDFDLEVFLLKRAEAKGVSFERFVASHLRRVFDRMGDTAAEDAPQRFNFRGERYARDLARMLKAEQASTYPHRSPVEVLWDIVYFGRLIWGLQDKRLKKPGAVPRLESDICISVSPQLTKAGINEVRMDAMEALYRLREVLDHVTRRSMGELMLADIDILAAICRRYGTFGAALLPGAFEPITGLCVLAWDGNAHRVFVQTYAHFYFFSMHTS